MDRLPTPPDDLPSQPELIQLAHGLASTGALGRADSLAAAAALKYLAAILGS